MGFSLGHELKPHGATAVSLTPGWLRSEAMLEAFGVTESNWRDATRRVPGFAISESPAFVGRAVAALAQDPDVSRWNGQSLSSGQMAKIYGFTDLDGVSAPIDSRTRAFVSARFTRSSASTRSKGWINRSSVARRQASTVKGKIPASREGSATGLPMSSTSKAAPKPSMQFARYLVPAFLGLATRTGSLRGTLSLADSPAPGPVVLLIAGSGPTDRDGNNSLLPGRNDHLKLLAEALSSGGISSLRYDKRGVAQSVLAAGREDDLRLETYVDDAVGWAKLIKNESRFSSLTVIGHSEGSLIGMIATQRIAAAGFVSLAGPGRAAPAIIREQLRGAPNLAGRADRILVELEAGRTTDSIPPELQSLFRPSVQPYLISWFHYDPAKEIAKITIPILIVQGSTDRQVSVEDARHLRQGNQRAQLRIVPGMNHLLKAVPDDDGRQRASFSDPAIPLHPMLIDEVSSFVIAADQRRDVRRH